ncbi:hypothetical protein B0J11DRAFT_203468 [Dendryphion nanum]|uniref:F-box domain-containing protein n=1 Tax=Dendryphion nanum TaxID=256645 RepID=A0A9P9D1T0_9PLEO|nr:hypothetical protein B0J11DRAFT_203468 [Dendryphion nanum]
MPNSSLLTLPPELICQIFESAHDFSTVSALARTSRVLYHIWRENPASICRAVAPRVFPNLTAAERLLDMQEEAESRVHPPDGREQPSLTRVKRLLSNARCASAALHDWVGLFLDLGIEESFRRDDVKGITPAEKLRFEYAFYYVWTIGVMGTTPHLLEQATDMLDTCSPQELCRLNELAEWALRYNEGNFGSSGLDLHDEVWKTGCRLSQNRWWMYHQDKSVAMPDYTPLNFYAFFDHTQIYLDWLEDE